MERLKLDAVDRAAFIFEKMMQPVIKMVNKAKSFEAVKKGLYKLYPRLKYQDFQKAIAQPCLVASVLGYIDSGSGSESIDFAEEIEIGFDTPFDLALEYAKQKGYALSPYHWQSVSEEQYRHAFTVARVTSMEVLQKIRERTDEALEEGTTLAQYKKDLIPFLREKGWFADPGDLAIGLDGNKRLHAHRLATVYNNNLGIANSVGRWKQLQDVKQFRPYVEYNGVDDESTRDRHRELFKLVWRVDDIGGYAPPNGHNCRCWLRSLTEEQVKGRDIVDGPLSIKPDLGWDYNPGAVAMDTWKPKPVEYDKAFAKSYTKMLARIAGGVAVGGVTAASAALAYNRIRQRQIVHTLESLALSSVELVGDTATVINTVQTLLQIEDKAWRVTNEGQELRDTLERLKYESEYALNKDEIDEWVAKQKLKQLAAQLEEEIERNEEADAERYQDFELPSDVISIVREWAHEEWEMALERYQRMIKRYQDDIDRQKADKYGVPFRKYKKKKIEKSKLTYPPIDPDLKKQIMEDARRIKRERRKKEKKLKVDPVKYEIMQRLEKYIKEWESDLVFRFTSGMISQEEWHIELSRLKRVGSFYEMYVEKILAEK